MVGVGEVQVACIGEDEGDNEVAVEVRITHYSFEYKYCVCNFNIPKITFLYLDILMVALECILKKYKKKHCAVSSKAMLETQDMSCLKCL